MEEGTGSATAYTLRLGVLLAAAAELGLLATAAGGPLAPVIRVASSADPQGITVGSLVGVAVVVASVALIAAGQAASMAIAVMAVGAGIFLYDATPDPSIPPALALTIAVIRPAVPLLVLGAAIAVAAAGRQRRWAATSLAVIGLGLIIAMVRAATYDPFFDPACASRCEAARPLLPIGAAATLQLQRVVGIIAGTSAVATAAVVVRAFGRVRDPARSVALAGCACLAVEVAIGTIHGSRDLDTRDGVALLATTLGVVGRLGIGVGLPWWAVRAVRHRVRVDQLAESAVAAQSAHVIEQLIGEAAGAAATLTFPLPGGAGEVGLDGEPASDGVNDPAATAVTRLGRRIATIRLEPAADAAVVVRSQPAAMLAAIDLERLRATRLAAVRLVRESRSRIVAAQDRERRRVERDLHDGAQQRILAAGVELSRAASHADQAGAADAQQLRAAAEMASAALDALRQLARGVHPAILSQGLGAALISLAEEAPIALSVEVPTLPSLESAVEMSAYRATVAMVAAAAKAGASHADVRVRVAGSRLELDLAFDGDGVEVPVRVSDRIGAVGGEIAVRHAPGQGQLVQAVLPCG